MEIWTLALWDSKHELLPLIPFYRWKKLRPREEKWLTRCHKSQGWGRYSGFCVLGHLRSWHPQPVSGALPSTLALFRLPSPKQPCPYVLVSSRIDAIRLQASLGDIMNGFSNLPAALLNHPKQTFLTRQTQRRQLLATLLFDLPQVVMEKFGFWLAIPNV